jgi:hypothetical protein
MQGETTADCMKLDHCTDLKLRRCTESRTMLMRRTRNTEAGQDAGEGREEGLIQPGFVLSNLAFVQDFSFDAAFTKSNQMVRTRSNTILRNGEGGPPLLLLGGAQRWGKRERTCCRIPPHRLRSPSVLPPPLPEERGETC